MLQIFPYLEDAALVVNLDEVILNPGQDYEDIGDLAKAAIRTPVPVLHCPSRRPAIAYPLRDGLDVYTEGSGGALGSPPNVQQSFGPLGARTDYAMNGGSMIGMRPKNLPEKCHVMMNNGIWAFGRRTKMKDVTDGTSKTYLVGEKVMDPASYFNGEEVMDFWPIVGGSMPNNYVRLGGTNDPANRSLAPYQDSAKGCISCHSFGSAHAGAWSVVMVDGGVRSLPYSMDQWNNRAFSSIDAGDLLQDLE